MVQRGILGNLRYDQSHHGWTTYVGDALARMVKWSDQAKKDKAVNVEYVRAVRTLNTNLQQYHVSYTVTDANQAKTVYTISKEVLDSICRAHSPSHRAFALIAIAHTLFQYDSIEKDPLLGSLASNFLGQINHNPDTQIELGVLCDAIKSQTNINKASRDLLQEFQAPLVILLVLADPRDVGHLRLSEEHRTLEHTLQSTKFRDSCKVYTVPSCRVKDLGPALRSFKPSIVHFSGHGSEHGLHFEDDDGMARSGNLQALADLLSLGCKYGLEAAVLNACESTTQAQPIADAVGTVVGMEGSILDESAIAFTRSFYRALGDGESFDEAYEWALKEGAFTALHVEDAAKPVLLKRNT